MLSPLKTDSFLTFSKLLTLSLSLGKRYPSQYPGAKVVPGLKAEYESRREQIYLEFRDDR
jgi:hypothetical protein